MRENFKPKRYVNRIHKLSRENLITLWQNVSWVDYILAILFGMSLVYIILYRAGTFASGYHFLDDHELIRMEVSFSQNHASLWGTMWANIRGDLSWRFRPFYWVERTLLAYFFGSKLLYWNYFTAVKLLFTTGFLYLAFRYLKCDPFVCVLSTGLLLLGEQFTPWYRSANQESTGLLLLAGALFGVTFQSYHKKYKKLRYNVLIILFTILCGWEKESFTLCIPVIIMLKFWLEYCDGAPNAFWKCLKNNLLTYCLLLTVLAVNIGIIFFYVGTDHVSYAGFHANTPLTKYLSWIVRSCLHNLYWYMVVGAVLLGFQVVTLCLQVRKNGIGRYRRPLGIAAISWYIILTQFVAHAKSGLAQRYIIPWIMGYVLLMVICGYQLLENTRLCKWIYVLAACVLLLQVAPTSIHLARSYTWDGQLIRMFFQKILDHTDENSQMICAFADDELNLATECWLETHGRTQAYSYHVNEDKLFNYVQIQGESPAVYDWDQAKVVVCYDTQIPQILSKMGLTEEDPGYTYDTYGEYAVIHVNSFLK